MLKNVVFGCLAGALMALAPMGASAQAVAGAGAATAEARARVACGGATLVSAQYLPGGLLQVTCSQQGNSNATQASVAGAGLAATPLLGAVLGAGFIAIIGGGGNPSDTTGTAGTTPTSSTTTAAGR